MSAVDEATALVVPYDTKTVDGMDENWDWWEDHDRLLYDAWQEFGIGDQDLEDFQDSFIHPHLRKAIDRVRENPTAENEEELRSMWKEIVPGVYSCQIFTQDFVRKFRAEIERHRESGIPMRRPNSMNRYGLMLNDKLKLHHMMQKFVARFVAPLAQMLFPASVGYSDWDDFHAFTVRYMEGEDRALSLHRDTSIATLNVNLNNPEDDFQGSQLYFYELGKVLSDSNKHYVTFEAGKALIHLGEQMHAATEILEGERTNLIIWMYRTPDPDDVFGYDHAIAKDYAPEEQMTVDQRWNPY